MVRLNRAAVRGLFLYDHLRYGDGGTLKAVRRDSSLGSDPNPPPRLWFRRTVSTLAVDQIQAGCRDRGGEKVAVERLVVAFPQAALSTKAIWNSQGVRVDEVLPAQQEQHLEE